MEISPSIFRAYDIRGLVTETFTPQVVRDIGRAFGSECEARGQSQVVVARDGRTSSPQLLEALIEGLVDSGRQVIDIGMVPTPVLYFATHHLKTGTGIMVTGSHNPPAYNGLKMMMGGETLYGEAIQRLYRRLRKNELISARGSREQQPVESPYLDRITSDLRLVRPLQIAIDCGNGVAGELAPKLFRSLGCEVTQLYCEIDGNFPHHHPDPSKPANLAELIDTVRRNSLDLGLAFDGDGDRLGVIDSQGRIIWPDRQMILYARDVLRRNPGASIIYDVKCSRHLARAIVAAGGKPIMWKTGHSLMKAKLRETGALLAGEMSGHIYFQERWYGFDDGLYSAARLLEILSAHETSTAARFSTIPDSLNTPELNLELAEGENFRFMEKLASRADFAGALLTTIDGLRVEFDDGWGLVRPSNTTPSLVIRFEAEDQATLQRIQEIFRRELLKVQPDLNLPF